MDGATTPLRIVVVPSLFVAGLLGALSVLRVAVVPVVAEAGYFLVVVEFVVVLSVIVVAVWPHSVAARRRIRRPEDGEFVPCVRRRDSRPECHGILRSVGSVGPRSPGAGLVGNLQFR